MLLLKVMNHPLRWLVLVVLFFTFTVPVFAQTKGEFLDKELEHFKAKGAKGYLIWQYSGDKGSPLGDTDGYSIFRDDLGDPNDTSSICGAMKKWSGQFEFLGYNVYSLGQGRGGPLGAGQIADQLNVLKNCGTNVVRVFISRSCPGSPSTVPECVSRMLAGAGSAGVKLILTAGDAANGGGGFPKLSRDQVASWYNGGWQSSEYPAYLQQTAQAARGNGNLYGIELANEPHCYDVGEAVAGYNQWAANGVATVKRVGVGMVGIGQMANNPNSSCDGPTTNLLPGNKTSGVTIVSAHYYSDDERGGADQAADKIVPSGLKFYIGESALLGIKKFAPKVPSGEFLPNDPFDVPKTVRTYKNPDVTIGNSITDSGAGLDTAFFEGATFYDAAIPGDKLDEVFQPALDGGGKLVPSSLQAQVQNPSQQKYPPGSPEELGHYDEVYDPGCTESHFAGGKQSSGEQYAKEAAQARTPDIYPDLQANLHNLSSILVPGRTSSLQWQVKQPDIVKKGADGKLTLTGKYPTRFRCGDSIDPKQVAAVSVPVIGPIQAIFSTVIDIVTSAWSLITGQVTVCDSNGKNCYTYNKYQAVLETTNTATIKTPAMPDIRDQAVGPMGSLGAFHPASIKERWPKDDGFTNKDQGSGNVLAATTDPNDPASLPHGGTYAFAKTWKLTSSCMLVPAAIQEQRGTKCELEGGGAAPPSQTASTAPSEATTGPAKQYLFEPVCNGQTCYDYIIAQSLSASRCGGRYLNPYAAMAIALNETGGLASNRSDGANIKHFGCDPFNRLGIAADPVSKFNCMVNTLTNRCSRGESDATALSGYGYASGADLNQIVNTLQGPQSCISGFCFRLFVSQSEAQQFALRLKNLLPTQKDLWYRYFSGYLRTLTGDVLKP